MKLDVQEKSHDCTASIRHLDDTPKPAGTEVTVSATKAEPLKRKWCYVLQPWEYGISGCPDCGNDRCQHSEWAGLCWCQKCQKDFAPKEIGLFDGPIGVECCRMLGIVFDRYELATGRVVKFGDPEWESCWP